MSVSWNPWHGCRKLSEGCRHCYVYRQDAQHDKDSREVRRTTAFNLPVRRTRDGRYKVPPGEMVYTCFTSDFLVEEADAWRAEAWEMIRIRSDLRFFFITKRIDRLMQVLPPDWGGGYENLAVGCTVENQAMADYRLPLLLDAPLRHKLVICAPLLGPLDIARYLVPGIEEVSVGGEGLLQLRLDTFDPRPMRRGRHPLRFPPNRCTACQRRAPLPHPPPVPAFAGPQGRDRLQGKAMR
mgnify:CR=1 FL=1